MSLRFGNCYRISLGSGVRSRMTRTTSNGRDPLNHLRGIRDVVVRHGDLGAPPDGRPIGEPRRHVLVVVEDRNFHGYPPLRRSPLGARLSTKEVDQGARYPFRVVFHWNVAGRLDPDEPRLRDFPCVTLGI